MLGKWYLLKTVSDAGASLLFPGCLNRTWSVVQVMLVYMRRLMLVGKPPTDVDPMRVVLIPSVLGCLH